MEWFVVVPPIITCIGVLCAVWQLRINHERDRRQFASKLIWDWALNSRQNTNVTVDLIHQLDQITCRKIFNQQPALLDKSHELLLNAALSEKVPGGIAVVDNMLKLDIDNSSHLRNAVTRYLNQVEAIFVAWAHGIADRKIIEHEFQYLVMRGGEDVYLKTYLEVCAWKTNYPAIFQYATHLDELRRRRLQPRDPPI